MLVTFIHHVVKFHVNKMTFIHHVLKFHVNKMHLLIWMLIFTVTLPTTLSGWGKWEEWSGCFGFSENRIRLRTRKCLNVDPDEVIKYCPESGDTETEACKVKVTSGWGKWEEWSGCFGFSDNLIRVRTRKCLNVDPAEVIKYCPESGDTETEACKVEVIPEWRDWGEWSSCTVSCGLGTRVRYRSCNNPEQYNGRKSCREEDKSDTEQCFTDPCSGWGKWEEWSGCFGFSDNFIRVRTRKCLNVDPAEVIKYCPESGDTETEACKVEVTPVHGAWGTWSKFGLCSVTCGSGVRLRTRECNNPPATFGGHQCPGISVEKLVCEQGECPIHGGWGQWQEWSECPVTCGLGVHFRKRLCNNPKPALGGRICPVEDSHEREECHRKPCPVDGAWSSWSDYEQCSVTCGIGEMRRTRKCNNPPPAHGGNKCHGVSQNRATCQLGPCPIHGRWSAWSWWSDCSVTCDDGIRHRFRECNNPPPSRRGRPCKGDIQEIIKCKASIHCPRDGMWSQWSDWGQCTALNCKQKIGNEFRYRSCNNPFPQYGGKMCNGKFVQRSGACLEPENCSTDGGWGSWSFWKCTENLAKRHRFCDNPTPKRHGKKCTGKELEVHLRHTNAKMFYNVCPEAKPKTELPDLGSGSGSGDNDNQE
ncbi:A disintegrin and metalloproteinase with thrombospondin motifs adt-1-like [Limulus polyphemus]|uniref:A disintegrin and metalloproteinase with thrombospondin motifs adt-1-like n=1 Tax=Limulus polyphemus TaxID=6850 RepID=A0ABM1BL18_LIMPO|nr:A disintegrin and metalloproteinase with thrombospondin motifs adt-1-like [Limulus polyphemus]